MSRFYNRTRTTRSIPRKLMRDGRPYLIPLYYLLRTSELGREGMEHSGSYRFADHIYEGVARGRFAIGRLIDAVLLRLKSARGLRARYTFAVAELRALIVAALEDGRPLDILAVPCGLGRELFELSDAFRTASQIRFMGLDLDGALIERLRANDRGITFLAGDALTPADYAGRYDVILSTGLTEFLDDDLVVHFYRTVRSRLRPGGRFITSGLDRHPPSDFLLRHLGDLHTHYRTEQDLRRLAEVAGFTDVASYRDATGLQTMLRLRVHGYTPNKTVRS